MSVSVCSILRLDVLLPTLACLSTCSPLSPHTPAADDSLLDARDFLSHFLSTMNLTDRRPQQGPPAAREDPPEYMLELYRRFSQDHTAAPSASVVRSFKNEDSSPSSFAARGVRRHPLLFNISLLHHEHITVAQLHLFTLVRRAQRPSSGVNRKVTIYRRRDGAVRTREAGKEGRRRGEEEVWEMQGLEELMTVQIHAKDNSWVSLDLTHTVTHWLKSGYSAHRLEVHITRPEEEGVTPEVTEEGEGDSAEVDIDRSLEGKHNAAIIVFSDDQSGDHNLEKQELHQMMEHEDDLRRQRGVFGPRSDQRDRQSRLQPRFVYDTPSRVRRGAPRESCKRSPLFVDFKDIGWDTWVIQPLGYEAYECKGACNPPMTSEVSPTKHAIVQSLLSAKSPKRASRACCVPTKLDPISLLYHENGVVTFKHKYEGMVVAECGCR